MTINKVLKKFVGVNEIRINSLNLDKTADGSDKLVIHVEPYKSKQCRCPLCNNDKKLPCYDSKNNLCTWRALDCGGVIVELQMALLPLQFHGLFIKADSQRILI